MLNAASPSGVVTALGPPFRAKISFPDLAEPAKEKEAGVRKRPEAAAPVDLMNVLRVASVFGLSVLFFMEKG